MALCLGYYCLSDVRLQALAETSLEIPTHKIHFKDRPDLNNWAAKLHNQKHVSCCSFADAEAISDAQWDMKDDHYRVYLEDHWIVVPDEAVIIEPNLYGQAVVWPIRYNGNVAAIRCFMPGSGT